MRNLAEAAEPLVQLLGSMARLEAADASFPVSVISGLHAKLARDLESEGTLYPKPASIAKFWLA
eukprot:3780556-Pleurochrysis_carterae.AAC.1